MRKTPYIWTALLVAVLLLAFAVRSPAPVGPPGGVFIPGGGSGPSAGVSTGSGETWTTIVTNCVITTNVLDTNVVVVFGAGNEAINGSYVWDSSYEPIIVYTNTLTAGQGIIKHEVNAVLMWEIFSGGGAACLYTNGSVSLTNNSWGSCSSLGTNPAPTTVKFYGQYPDTNCVVTTNTVVISNGVVTINGTPVVAGGLTNLVFIDTQDDGVNVVAADAASWVSAQVQGTASNNISAVAAHVDVNSADETITRVVATHSKVSVASDGAARNNIGANQSSVWVFNSGSRVEAAAGSGLNDLWIYATGDSEVTNTASLSRQYVYVEEGAKVTQVGQLNDMQGNANGGTAIQGGAHNRLQFFVEAASEIYQGGNLNWMSAHAGGAGTVTNTGDGNIMAVDASEEDKSVLNTGSWSALVGWGFANANSQVLMGSWYPTNYFCAMSNQTTIRYGTTWLRVNGAGVKIWGASGDLDVSGSGTFTNGVILVAPDLGRWRLKVSNIGVVTTESVP